MKRVELKLVLPGGAAASELFVAAAADQVLPNQTYFRQTIFGLDINSNAWKSDQMMKMTKRRCSKIKRNFPQVFSTKDRCANLV